MTWLVGCSVNGSPTGHRTVAPYDSTRKPLTCGNVGFALRDLLSGPENVELFAKKCREFPWPPQNPLVRHSACVATASCEREASPRPQQRSALLPGGPELVESLDRFDSRQSGNLGF